mmetsp:Transcript_11398/g.24162  ORF Transcript_11398/g.24162 Transcript_11398/m.24162 type:complete len:80 (-) Transcript_11398:402-641(-)
MIMTIGTTFFDLFQKDPQMTESIHHPTQLVAANLQVDPSLVLDNSSPSFDLLRPNDTLSREGNENQKSQRDPRCIDAIS